LKCPICDGKGTLPSLTNPYHEFAMCPWECDNGEITEKDYLQNILELLTRYDKEAFK
jgi:hypothetical protein